jgi:tetrahydromethanopterin S-methyltransferase subunit G
VSNPVQANTNYDKMTTKTQDDVRTNGTEKTSSIRDRLDDLEEPIDTAIDEVVRKIENGRVYDAENEKVRIKRKRALGYLVRTKLKIAEARELEELAERVEEIEQRQTEPQGGRL